ncbi:MAG: GNAT family N-acetyltransferase [Candidatus Eremiobacteraeota bacterium]|nr:GNAT family N-acetyltransferase [Candidatus Eremiobacteraeota bacterium]
MIAVEPIGVEAYVRDVLPQTFALWGDGRTFERYADDLRAVAGSLYGKRRPFTVGIYEGDEIACSCKNYARELRFGERSLRATGVGAVFTPAPLRGRGYSSAMLGALLDAERAAGRDVAFLYSDIGTAFYAELGFIALPSRLLTVRAAFLDGSPAGAVPLGGSDWPAVRRCFEALDTRRRWSLRRTPLVWDWMRDRWNAPQPPGTQPVALAVRRGRSVAAYAIGRRVPAQDTFVLDDFAYANDEDGARLPALLRAAAGDLRRVAGWLPPSPAREMLPRGSVRPRKNAILMIAPLSAAARSWWGTMKEEAFSAQADATWSSDHI